MTDKKLNIGVIGAGRIGKLHANNLVNRVPRANLVAVSDVYLKGARELADSLGVKNAYENYQDIINNPEIDAVFICAPTDLHSPISIEAARAGKHIFCEKPIDHDLKKIEAVLEEVQKAGVKYQVGFNRRFDRNFKKVRETVKNGAVGDVHIVKVTSRDPAPPHPGYIKASGGIFVDMTIHDFDMARFLTGSEAEEIYVAGACMVDPAIGEAGDLDTAVITIKFQNGVLCVIDNSRKAVYGYDQRVEAFGSKGQAEIANDKPSTASWSTADGVYSEKPLHFFLERYMAAYAEEIKEFVEALMTGKETPVTGFDGLQPLKMGMAALKSVKEGRPVKLSEI